MNRFKKIFGVATILSLLMFACKKSDAPLADLNPGQEVEGSFSGLRNCGTYEVLQRQLREDPTLQARMDAARPNSPAYAELDKAIKEKQDTLAKMEAEKQLRKEKKCESKRKTPKGE